MKSKAFLLILLSFILISCTDKQTQKEIQTHAAAEQMQTYINQIKSERDAALEKYVAEMPLEQKIGQMFIENLEGCTKFRCRRFSRRDVSSRSRRKVPLHV